MICRSAVRHLAAAQRDPVTRRRFLAVPLGKRERAFRVTHTGQLQPVASYFRDIHQVVYGGKLWYRSRSRNRWARVKSFTRPIAFPSGRVMIVDSAEAPVGAASGLDMLRWKTKTHLKFDDGKSGLAYVASMPGAMTVTARQGSIDWCDITVGPRGRKMPDDGAAWRKVGVVNTESGSVMLVDAARSAANLQNAYSVDTGGDGLFNILRRGRYLRLVLD
jgi:hypothetical protein